VTTSNGYFVGFLTVIPSLFSAFETHVALLSSLTEVSVIDCCKNNQIIVKVALEIEPTFLRMGPIHFCVGINSAISYYKWRSNKAKVVCKRDYFTSIKAVCMNDIWTAVLSTVGTVSLHMIEDAKGTDIKFPQGGDTPIIQMHIIDAFLILLDQKGKVRIYLIEDAQTAALITEHQAPGGNIIEKVFPNRKGTRLICIDSTGNGYLYNPVDDSQIMIPNFSATTTNVLFDLDDRNLFVTVDPEKMHTYLYAPLSLEGSSIIPLPEYLKLDEVDKQKPGVVTFLDKDLKPIILKSGFVYSHARTDGVRGQYLTTHSYMTSWRGQNDTDEGHLRYFL